MYSDKTERERMGSSNLDFSEWSSQSRGRKKLPSLRPFNITLSQLPILPHEHTAIVGTSSKNTYVCARH